MIIRCPECKHGVEAVFTPRLDRWKVYETEKKKLQALNMTPREYEQAVRRLAKRIGV